MIEELIQKGGHIIESSHIIEAYMTLPVSMLVGGPMRMSIVLEVGVMVVDKAMEGALGGTSLSALSIISTSITPNGITDSLTTVWTWMV